jgi:ABC-type multidrug transport system fused ATPase/permease subunit
MEVNDDMARKMLGAVTTKYAATDLVHGLPPRLNGELLNALGMFAAGWGLSVKNIPLVVISCSEDRLAIAEKTQALQERLQDVALQAKMAEIENQAQLDEFIQQVDPQAGAVLHPQVAQVAPAEVAPALVPAQTAPVNDAPSAARKPGEYLRTLLGRTGRGNSRRGGLLAALFHQKPKATAETRELPHLWWLRRGLWIAVVLIVGGILTYLVVKMAASASLDWKLGLLGLIWVPVIKIIMDNIKVLYEKSEAAFEVTRASSASSRLDDLVGDDRRRADELVREQCQKELGHVREVLQDIRTREFKRDKTEMALKLRNELERNAEEGIKKIGNSDFGCPAYVTDLHLNRNAWNEMLNYDEDVLGYAHALSDKAHLLQQKSQADGLDMAQLASFDSDISDFCNRFFERGRPIKILSQETN